MANNFSTTAWAFNKLLNVVSAAHSVLGAAPLKAISSTLNRWTGHMVPEWNPYMPKVRGGPVVPVGGVWGATRHCCHPARRCCPAHMQARV